MGKCTGIVASLKARGFDLSHAVPFEHGAHVGCSQCEALVINGVACHEHGCPNRGGECDECGSLTEHGRRLCESCGADA